MGRIEPNLNVTAHRAPFASALTSRTLIPWWAEDQPTGQIVASPRQDRIPTLVIDSNDDLFVRILSETRQKLTKQPCDSMGRNVAWWALRVSRRSKRLRRPLGQELRASISFWDDKGEPATQRSRFWTERRCSIARDSAGPFKLQSHY